MSYISNIRAKVGHEKLLVPGAAALVINERGEVLLHRRSDTGEWGIIGGVMEPGETVLEGVRREAKEEASIELDSLKLFAIYSGSEFESAYPNGDQLASVTVVFLTQHDGEEPKPSDESTEISFFSIDDPPEPLDVVTRTAIGHLREHRDGRLGIPVIL